MEAICPPPRSSALHPQLLGFCPFNLGFLFLVGLWSHFNSACSFETWHIPQSVLIRWTQWPWALLPWWDGHIPSKRLLLIWVECFQPNSSGRYTLCNFSWT